MSEQGIQGVPEPQAPAPYTGPTGLSSNISASDLRLPRVALLQALSPLVQNEPDKYRQGMFINTLTLDIIPAPIVLIPVFLFKNAVKFRPREEGGGIIYRTTTFTKDVLKDLQWNGTEKPIATQFINVVCLIDGQETPLLVSFHDTNFKTGQDLLTLVQMSGCAWKYNYTLESYLDKRPKGTFYNLRIKRGVVVGQLEQDHALDLYKNVSNMAIETDYEEPIEGTATDADPKEF